MRLPPIRSTAMIKLLQVNTYQGRLSRPLLQLIQTVHADVVCLQEIVDLEGDSGFFATLRDIQAAGSFKHVYSSPTYSFRHMRRIATYGNAILSRRPFIKTYTNFVNLGYTEDFDIDVDDTNIRNFQHVIIEVDQQSLHVVNHHGCRSPQGKLGSKQTMYLMDQLVDYLEGLDGPLLVAGDFNLAPDSESLNRINLLYRNLPKIYQLETTRTSLAKRVEVCDYVFASADIHVLRFYVSEAIVSDHHALILEFTVPFVQ
jgi:endonuclease/exonuclease/phosphatase family metal-dependent hydrolase